MLSIDKAAIGTPQPVAGTDNEFVVRYAITVSHVSGGPGVYDLIDTPQFDADASIVSATSTRGSETAVTLPTTTPWTLATDRGLAIGATDTYTLDVRVRVVVGSDQANDACNGSANNGLFNLATLTTGSGSQNDDACHETPKPETSVALAIEKIGSVRQAEVGDMVSYTIRIRNNGTGPALQPVVVDRLPAGFTLVGNSARVRGATLLDLAGAPGPVLRLTLDRINAGAEVTVAYRVRLGVGAQQGDGINRAHVECPALPATTTVPCSNESQWEVDLRGGVFSEEGCVAGQVFVDCNYNSVKDGEELGIPGVRMYFENGTYMISDSEGKYSYCGLRPVTHVLKVDPSTLPTRSRMVTSSTRNTGDAGSLVVDMKNGELHRADFIEGSCNNEVVEQVKARKGQGETSSVQHESSQPELKFQSKPLPQSNPPQQGTDSANQIIEQTRHDDVPAANDDEMQEPLPANGTDGG